MNVVETQTKLILKYLNAGNYITPIEALNLFGCMRLSARIHDLKTKGHNIVNIWLHIPNGKKVARYKLINHEPIKKEGLPSLY